jgi:hypothetical protein
MNPRLLRPYVGLAAVLLCASVRASDPADPLAWHGITEVAAGRGERGPWRQNESKYDYVDDPAVAINDNGEIAVAWVEQASKDVFFQRYSRDGIRQTGQPLNVSRSPATFSWLPRVVIAPDAPQKVFILWQEIIFAGASHGGDILFARSNDGGATFSEPINISNSVGGDGKGRINRDIWHNGSLDLATGVDGSPYATWTEYDGQLWFSRSTDGGASFSRPRRVGARADVRGAKPARGPSLAVGADRTVYLAWTTGEDNAADIHVAKSTDGGMTFDAPRIVAPSKGYSDAPKLAVDPDGVVHLVYAESAGGPFDRYHIRYTRSTDGARTFEAPRDISKPLPKSVAGAAFPSLAVDARGNLYVMWESYHHHRERPRGLGLVVSHDGGRNFSAPAVVPGSMDPAGGSNGSRQGLLMKKLAVNSSGAVAIVNSSLKDGERSRVWLIRAKTLGSDARIDGK